MAVSSSMVPTGSLHHSVPQIAPGDIAIGIGVTEASDRHYPLPFLCTVNIQASIVCELCEMEQNYSVDA